MCRLLLLLCFSFTYVFCIAVFLAIFYCQCVSWWHHYLRPSFRGNVAWTRDQSVLPAVVSKSGSCSYRCVFKLTNSANACVHRFTTLSRLSEVFFYPAPPTLRLLTINRLCGLPFVSLSLRTYRIRTTCCILFILLPRFCSCLHCFVRGFHFLAVCLWFLRRPRSVAMWLLGR